MSLLVECVAGSRWVIPSVKKLSFSKIKSTKRFPTHLRFSLLFAIFILIATASLFITHTELPPPLSTTMSVACTTLCEGDPPKDPLSIPEDEADLVLLSNPSDTDEDDLPKRMLAGKILAPKPLNKSGVRNALKSLWEDFGEVSLLEGVGNCFAFTFQSKEEASEVLQRSPWCWDPNIYGGPMGGLNPPYTLA